MLLTAPAGVAGGLGLIGLGWSVAHAGARRLDGGWIGRALDRARDGGWKAVMVGAGTCALPVGGVHARAPVALIGARQLRLGPALHLALGIASVELVTVGALVLGSARPAAFLLAMITLGLVAAATLLLRSRAVASSACQIVAGWCAIVAGAHLVTQGFAESGTTVGAALDWNSFWLRGLGVVLVGAALTAVLDCGTLVAAVAIGAACGGVLSTSAAAALLVGVRVGAGLSVLPQLRRADGDERRVALGVAVMAAVHGLYGLLVIAILLPMLVHHGAAPVGPALTLLGFQVAFVTTALLASLPFRALLEALLDDAVEQGDAAGSFEAEHPGIAHLALRDRVGELRRIARGQARAILANKGMTDFRLRVDLDQTRRLAGDCAAISKGMLEGSLSPWTLEGLDSAARARDLPDLIEELMALENDPLRGLREAEPRLAERFREAELTTLSLVQSSLGELGTDLGDQLAVQAQLVSQKLGEVERLCLLAVAAQRLPTDQALQVVWRAGRIRSIAQLALGVSPPGQARTGAAVAA